MKTFAALKIVDPRLGPAPYYVVYGSPEIRDRMLAEAVEGKVTTAADIAFSRIAAAELDHTVVFVLPNHPHYETIVGAYVSEKIGQLRGKVELDVEKAISRATPDMVDGMTWVASFSVAEASFSVQIDGRGGTTTLGVTGGKLDQKHLNHLVQKTIVSIKRAVVPVLLRTTPRPPFLTA